MESTKEIWEMYEKFVYLYKCNCSYNKSNYLYIV